MYSSIVMLFFFQMYKDSDLHEEKSRISQALGSIKDEKLLQKVLDFAMSVSKLSKYKAYCENVIKLFW